MFCVTLRRAFTGNFENKDTLGGTHSISAP